MYLKRIWGVMAIAVLAFSACAKSGPRIPVSEVTNKTQLYVWIDKLSLREAPGLDSKVIEMVPFGGVVYDLGESSELTTEVTLRCRVWKTNWIKVALIDGRVGWVYAGGVKLEAANPLPVPLRIVVAYYPKPKAYYLDPDDSRAVNETQKAMEQVQNAVWDINREKNLSIFYKEAYSDEAGCVAIGDETYPAYSFDLSQYLTPKFGFTDDYGFLFIQEGKSPQYYPVADAISNFAKYFQTGE